MASTFISIPVAVPSTITVTGPLTDAQLRATPVPVSGTVTVITSNGTLTDYSVALSTTSAQVVAANVNRKYLLLQNSSGAVVWFNFGTAAVNNSPSIRLGVNEVFIMEGLFVSTQAVHARSGSGTPTITIKEG